MRKLKTMYLPVCCLAVCMMILTNCVKKTEGPDHPGNGGQEGNKFNYTTTSNVKIDVDYSMKGNKALFEIYAEEPVEMVNGVLKKKEGVNNLLKAYTDKDSKFSGVVNLPTDVAKVYLYTESYGLPTCVEAKVTSGNIVFNLQDFLSQIEKKHSGENKAVLAQAKGISTKSADNPYNIITLGNWTNSGRPYYIEGEKQGNIMVPMCMPTPEGLEHRVQNILLAGKDNSQYAKSTETVNINVTRDAHITFIFLSELAGWKNSIGYYYYNTKNPPKTREDFDKLPKYLAFPNCSMYHSSSDEFGSYYAPMAPGVMMQMIYYDQNNQPSTIFPGGTTIGWFLLPDAFSVSNTGTGTFNIAGTQHPICYSNNEFNKNQDKYCVSLYDKTSGKTILGFEDGGDNDYKDVLFYLESDPVEAIYDPDKPTTDPEEQYPDITGDPIEGTLAFEDLWPSQGDYDMNDIVIKYSTAFTTDKDNKIVAIKDVFTPLHNGGQLKTAFGYLLDMPASDVTSVQIENGSSSAILTNGLETKQDKAVVMLLDNIQQALSKGSVTVTLKLKGNQSLNTVTRKSLYNPFICPSVEGFRPGQLRKEVHLTNYAPTQLADLHFFGINDDKSSVDKEGNLIGPYYYGTSDLYPFAIDLPVTDYRVPNETVKIDTLYPQFTEWAKSKGEKNKDWYRHPAKK